MTAESQQRHPDLGVRDADRPSLLEVTVCAPSVLNPTSVSAVASPSRATVSRPSPACQIRATPSVLALASEAALGPNVSAVGCPLWPTSVRMRVPVRAQRRTVSSAAPVATRRLSREIAAETAPRCRTFVHGPGLYVDQPSAVAAHQRGQRSVGRDLRTVDLLQARNGPNLTGGVHDSQQTVPTGEERDPALGERDVPRRRAGRERVRPRAGAAVGHDSDPEAVAARTSFPFSTAPRSGSPTSTMVRTRDWISAVRRASSAVSLG